MISQHGSTIRRLLLIVVLGSGVSACSSQEPLSRAPAAKNATVVRPQLKPSIGERAAAIALRQVGTPYRYGGASPRGFDCSGLVHYSYANAGKTIPRTTSGLWASLMPVDSGRVRAGDLLFFNIAGKMSHVGMYIGNGRFVHAPSTGKTVSVEHLDNDYYRRTLIRAGRPR